MLAGCASNDLGAGVAGGSAAYGVIPPPQKSSSYSDYAIGPLDTLNVTVFQEPDLSVEELVVDASGGVSLPLVGRVQAVGLTASQLAGAYEDRLRGRYLIQPSVSVSVTSSVSQRVTVQGEVMEPGIYDLKGPTTLLDTLSLAKGETELAKLDQVVVIRTIEGRRAGALFDLKAIRRNEAPDPQILGNDVVIVGHAPSKQLWRDFLRAAPVIGLFRYF